MAARAVAAISLLMRWGVGSGWPGRDGWASAMGTDRGMAARVAMSFSQERRGRGSLGAVGFGGSAIRMMFRVAFGVGPGEMGRANGRVNSTRAATVRRMPDSPRTPVEIGSRNTLDNQTNTR